MPAGVDGRRLHARGRDGQRAEPGLHPTIRPGGPSAWAKVFGSPDSEIAWGVAADGKALTVTGYTFGDLDADNAGSFDVFVRRYNRAGTAVWKRQFGTTKADLGIDVAADGKGFTILGHTQGALGGDPKGNLDVFVRRYTR